MSLLLLLDIETTGTAAAQLAARITPSRRISLRVGGVAELLLEITRNDGRAWDFYVIDPDTGDAVSLLDAAIAVTAKLRLADADAAAIFQLEVGTGVVVSEDGLSGTFTLSPSDTAGLTNRSQTLRWDMQVTPNAEDAQTVAYGILLVRPEVTLP